MGRENALKERHAYNGILRGIIALIVFSVIILTPHIITFVSTTTMDYDDDSTYEGGLDLDESPSSCFGEDSDGKKCFEELKSAEIILILIQILIYSIPIYGLIEVYRGVSRISELRTTIGIELSESTHPIKLDNAKNDIDMTNTEDVEELEELNESKISIPGEVFDLVVIIILAIAIAYLLSTF
tara:strand:+ start:259 stop:810 length:552 start_codon:yes stop_codon:yes gene_type:complete